MLRTDWPPVFKTGWPPSELMQDDDRKLSIWFATRMDAGYLLKYVVYRGTM